MTPEKELKAAWKQASDAASRRDAATLERLAEMADRIAAAADGKTHADAESLAAYCRGAGKRAPRPSLWATITRLLRLREKGWVDCPSCGHTGFATDKFCSACGAPIDTAGLQP